jgi:two-component system sensor histidine kinase PhoQ
VPYTFAVAETMEPLLQEIAGFRRTLWIWLSGATLVLLLVQGMVLRWGLSPLRQVATALQRIESGDEDRLKGDYPPELRGLTRNLNALLDRTRASQERYRNSLADLAHSLKTPLAILRGAAAEGGREALRPTVDEQVQRMDEIVRHQLQRAAASGRSTLIRSVPLAPVVDKVLRAMDKVYSARAVESRTDLSPDARFFGDEADLFEILGNLLDNAYKYCRGRVLVAAGPAPSDDSVRAGLELRVEDDGPGIPEEQVSIVLQRGRRADQREEGHGIGLTVVDEIVRLYEGSLTIGRSELGGVSIRVRLAG